LRNTIIMSTFAKILEKTQNEKQDYWSRQGDESFG
jgi:hypothetical protein